jgi:molybdopterin-guanine dinucleotide biosynthesis protein A
MGWAMVWSPLAVLPGMPDKIVMRLGAIILAGGRSTRMGRPKESLPFGSGTLLGNLGTTLAACAHPVVVVARDGAQALPPLPAGVARTHDALPDQGPLAGLAAGMTWLLAQGRLAPTDACFVTACDHPFLTAATVRWLAARLGDDDAVVPQVGEALQPLCAVYRLVVAPRCRHLLAMGVASPRSLALAVRTRIVEADELRTLDPGLRFLRNLNTPADYDEARR